MYKLEDLNYLYQDLEPYVDTHTMGTHYNKHAKKYLNNLNQLLLENNFDFSLSLVELAQNIDLYSWKNKEEIIFNLGGVINHNLYFHCMNKKKIEVTGKIRNDLINKYGSIEEFVQEFISISLKLKGSGYTFLELTSNGLEIKNYSNQDNPLFSSHFPLFTIDLWEHAYYINYNYDKKKYLENFFEIADFSVANHLYEKIKIS